MEAIIKLKRHASDDPIETLVLSCKKRKLDSEVCNNQESLALLKFAGRVEQQEDVKNHINKLRKDESKKLLKSYVPDITEKARIQTKATSLKNRYKVVNCFRALDDTVEPQKSDASNHCTILEVENEEKEENQENIVYDLYYINSSDVDVSLDNLLSVHSLEDELVFNKDDSSSEGETDDSNDENNWRNDYPDSDINEDDMMNAMQGLSFGEGDRDLSSDDEEEGFVYSIDSEASGFHEDIDETDVMRYGERYARFKARVKNMQDTVGIDRDLFYDEIDDDSES